MLQKNCKMLIYNCKWDYQNYSLEIGFPKNQNVLKCFNFNFYWNLCQKYVSWLIISYETQKMKFILRLKQNKFEMNQSKNKNLNINNQSTTKKHIQHFWLFSQNINTPNHQKYKIIKLFKH